MSVMLNYLFNLGSGFAVGFFVGTLISGIIFIGNSVVSMVSEWVAEKRMERVDIASIGVLEDAPDAENDISEDTLERRSEAWKEINDLIQSSHNLGYRCHDVPSRIYGPIPYKALIKTLKHSGYKISNICNARFTKSDYDNGYHVRIEWR